MQCKICKSETTKIIDLPKFPLTGIFCTKNDNSLNADQELLYCNSCGHAQLGNLLSPTFLYDNSYTHRGSISSIATGGNDFFYNFLEKIIKNRKFKGILDLGCNDFYLLKKVAHLSNKLIGIDPIWKEKKHFKHDGIDVIGDFIENISLAKEIAHPIDLVISSHAIEHIHNPLEQLQKIVEYANNDALFIIEVPSFNTVVETLRFDQIFHQHIQYFSTASMETLINNLGCEYISHTFNYNFWQGTMLFAFQKKSQVKQSKKLFNPIDLNHINNAYSYFKHQLNHCFNSISKADTDIFGFGAAQMVPTLAYHMGTDLSFLKAILDDNKHKHNLVYPNLSPKINFFNEDINLNDANVLILALDSLRPILKKVLKYSPKRIFLPLNII